MPSSTPKYIIPFSSAGDAVTSVPSTSANLAARLDLLLGEAGTFTASGTAATTFSQAIVLSRTYPGLTAGAVPGSVWFWHNQILGSGNTFNYWINTWTGSGTTITGFTFNCQFSAVWTSRVFTWRFLPVQ